MSTQRYSVTPQPIDVLLDGQAPDYETFLRQHRLLMAKKIQTWLHSL